MEEQIALTTADLQNIVNIIDLCAERGAFKGSELFLVGQLRKKLEDVYMDSVKQTT